jgi:PAS domain S-box-containing protein
VRQLDFRGLVDAAADVIAVFDRDHRCVYVNAALERATGVSGALLGQRIDDVMTPEEAAVWREALDDVLCSGRQRAIECTMATQQGLRRFASVMTQVPGELVCAVSRDVTDVRSNRLLDIAAQTMATGMVIVEAPSGGILFKNDETERIFGKPFGAVHGALDESAVVAFDEHGRQVAKERWPLARALAGERTIDERIEVHRHDGARRTIIINASPVRGRDGRIIAAASTYYDVTEAKRVHEAARYLAEAGALLERFDPGTSLQAIVDLAVPVLADWCFIHINTAGHPEIVAIANADPVKVAAARARAAVAPPLSPDTAVARVLAGGPREIVDVDPTVLAQAARDPAHLEQLRHPGYKSAVVAPLAGRDGVLGAVTFAMAESGRRYDEADLDMLAELARRTGIALDNARLFAAEQEARRHAEEARDRMRRLQKLTATLSSAVEKHQVVSIMVDAGRAALGAAAGFAWLLRDDATLELAGCEHAGKPGRIEQFKTISMTAPLPICDAIRSARSMLFENRAAMTAGYPSAIPPGESSFRAWAVIPFVVAGRGVGGLSFSFSDERLFSEEDRELLAAMMGQASLALERCMLLEAERRARADAEAARQRERQLHVLAARLSSALTPPQVGAIACEEVVSVLRAYSSAASVHDGAEVRILGTGGPRDEACLARVARVPLAAAIPIAEAVRRAEPVWCASEAELAARYAHVEGIWRKLGIRSWGAVPFRFEGGTVGSLALSFTTERELSSEDREFLSGVGQLTAQALERARLYEALQTGEERLRVALTVGRAATWRLDLATGIATRDPAYRAMLGVRDEHAVATDEAIHPDDRAAVRAQFERTLRDGTPFEPEVRMRRDDGTYIWTRSHGRLMYGPDGKPSMLAGVIVDIDEAKQASLRADEERRINETLHRLGSSFASELDHDRLARLITNEITSLVGAEFGAYFHSSGEAGSFAPHTISSGHVERYRDLPSPHATPLLAQTLVARQVVRLDDVLADPRYGATSAQPEGHPVVRSYLAVPVVARSGEVFGSLLFGHPEVGRFTAVHERLAASIASQAAVALENARLYKTVREQKEQLELAVEHVRLADRRKDEFLAMLGHELRNPLAPIATALELMDLKGISVLHKERDVIRRQVDHLSRLIDDLLDVSRITRGKIQLNRQVLEIGTALAKAIEIASPLLEKRLQRLAIDVPRDGLAVDADPTRLAQVFQNLLTNAAKYSEPGSQIVLRARRTADRVIVEVTDQGIGISADLMPRLFELFVQGDRALDRSQGGLGIGLTIAKSLCELHGGTISAASAGIGHGSTFTVTLPRAVRADPPGPVRASEPVARIATGLRVLVVDDNVDAAQTLHEFLSTLGHESAVAHDGVEALELARGFRPDIAVLDIGLPVMDGYELARRLRGLPGSKELLLIAVTGYGQETDRARAREAGFDHHLVKPIALDALVPLLATRT